MGPDQRHHEHNIQGLTVADLTNAGRFDRLDWGAAKNQIHLPNRLQP